MDPITQGALGATAGQIIKKNGKVLPISLMGALAAMSPDLDVLIRSSEDPLLSLEFHRQFTHSLLFIPYGALICAVLLHALIGRRHGLKFWHSYGICLLGYGTHALLDACTTYGTLLLWPLSLERFAWNTIAVVDFFYTLPILFALALGLKYQSPWPARIAVFWVFFYPYLGHIQKEKAEEAAKYHLDKLSRSHFEKALVQPELNLLRYDKIKSLGAKPSMSNIVLWKIVYEAEGRFHVDAIRVGIFQDAQDSTYYPGDSVEKLDIGRDLSWLDPDSQQAKDLERFSWFSMDFVAVDKSNFTPKHNNDTDEQDAVRIMDIRYSMIPNEIKPLWSIELNRSASDKEHVSFENHRDTSSEVRQRFFDMLFGQKATQE